MTVMPNDGCLPAIAVTATSAATLLPAPNPYRQTATILNRGTKDAYVAFGDDAVTATVSNVLVPAGKSVSYSIPNGATYVAAICGGSDSTNLALYMASGPVLFS